MSRWTELPAEAFFSSARKVLIFLFVVGGVLVPARTQTAPNAAALYKQGLSNLDQEQPFQAIENFKDALRVNPNYFDPIVSLATTYYFLDEYDEALRYVQQAIPLGKDNPKLLNINGRILLALGKTDEASAIFKSVLAKEPFNVDALLGMAEFSLSKGDDIGALAQYQKSLQYNQKDRRILLALSLMYESKGDRAKAEQYLLRALDTYAESPMVQAMAAEYYLRRRDYNQAQFHAQTALSLSPNYERALELLATIKLFAGDYNATVSTADQLLTISKDNARAWYLRGMALLKLNKPSDAITAFERVLSITPDDEIARILLEDTVISTLPEEDTIRSRYAAYHFEQAALYRKKNLNTRADFEYERGLRVAPLDQNGRQQYADFLKASGRSAAFYEQLKALDKLGVKNTFVSDNLEIYGSLLTTSISNKWGVDQFLVDRDPLLFRTFYIPARQSIEHPLAEMYLARYAQMLMQSSPKISFTKDRSEFSGEIAPRAVDSESAAFATARDEKTDYYIVLDFSESTDDFQSKLSLDLSRTGNAIKNYASVRSGNFRVQNAIDTVVETMQSELPLRGRLQKRNLDLGLVNLGANDGLKAGDVLHIVTPDSYVLRGDAPGFIFSKDKKTGTFTIGKTDDMISEGNIQREGFFDKINIGDVILKDGESQGRSQEATSNFPFLYNKIRAIR